MLKPALLYTEEITRKFAEHLYTTDYYYYCGYYCGSTLPKIEEKDDLYQYAFVDDNDNVIGFLTYRINDYSDTVQDFGLFSFEKGNLIVARDLFKKLEELVKRHHKVEWYVVGNNPVKRNYDRFCKKHNGYIHHYHETTKDENGNYIDSFFYEIVNTKKKKTNYDRIKDMTLKEMAEFIADVQINESQQLRPLPIEFMDTKYVGKLQEEWLRKEADC